MPRPKRWFHVSQDINHDPEFEKLCKLFGLGGVRFFMQVMSILDKTGNHWSLHKDFDLNVLARCCGTKPKIILGSYQLLIDMNWISVAVDEGMDMFIYAPNFLKYRGNRVHGKEMPKRGSCSPPSLPFPSLPKDKEKTLKKESKRKTSLPQNFALTSDRQKKALDYWEKHGVACNVVCEFDAFLAFYTSRGTLNLDWDATWRTWYIKATGFAKTSHANGTGRKPFPIKGERTAESVKSLMTKLQGGANNEERKPIDITPSGDHLPGRDLSGQSGS